MRYREDVTSDRDKLMRYAEEHLGASYSTKPSKGFDCSGFVRHCYRHIGVELGRTSRDQWSEGSKISTYQAQLGDIIVFKGRNIKSTKAGHVGLIHHTVGDTIYFIHASSSKGVIISHQMQPYYQQRFMGIVTVLDH